MPNYDEAVNARTSDYRWPAFLGKDTDPGESLSRLQIPGLWIFGEHDGSIPVDLSTRRLDQLNSNKARFDYRVIPHVGHNNITDTFDIAIEWITALSN